MIVRSYSGLIVFHSAGEGAALAVLFGAQEGCTMQLFSLLLEDDSLRTMFWAKIDE